MSTINLYFKIEAYDDEEGVVAPILQDFNWIREIDAIDSDKIDVVTRSCPAGATTIDLPDTTITLLYIEANGQVYIRLNGDVGDTNVLTPSTTGTMDAVYFKRGSVTSLVIFNPGISAVNVKVFMGS